jgi:hypothetical protein
MLNTWCLASAKGRLSWPIATGGERGDDATLTATEMYARKNQFVRHAREHLEAKETAVCSI